MFRLVLATSFTVFLLTKESFSHNFLAQDVISTNISRTKYYLWTRNNPIEEQELVFADMSSIESSNFDGAKKTMVLVHGYTGNGKQSWILDARNKYLDKDDCNVISVDWEPLAGPDPWYPIAVANAKKVGARTGRLLALMKKEANLSFEDVHVIGWSLGGQLVAFIGQELGGDLARITALDPAGFLFHTAPPESKLSPDDAKFVDVIHTAGLWMGTDEKVGHIDFYPNGGQAPQPGCEDEDPFGIDCSHQRAPDFFIESIQKEKGFRAVICSSLDDFEAGLCHSNAENFMGESATLTQPGDYFLKTNPQPPFAIEQ